jgi:Zn-dependent peptidase ImmA (M78 family)
MKTSIDQITEDLSEIQTAVKYGHLGKAYDGYYFDDEQTVYLRSNLTPIKELSTLAHEEYHAINRHTGSPDRETNEWREICADMHSSKRLIDIEEYKELERIYGCHYEIIADELGVTLDVIHGLIKSREYGRDWAFDKP